MTELANLMQLFEMTIIVMAVETANNRFSSSYQICCWDS